MSTISIDDDVTEYTLIVIDDETQRLTLSLRNEDAVALQAALARRNGHVQFAPLPPPKPKSSSFLARVKEVLHGRG